MLIGLFSQYLFGIAIFVTSVFLVMLVLVQRGRGGGLVGALGGPGGQSALGTKAGDIFTRITIVVAAIWIFLCAAAVRVLNPSDSNPLTGLDEVADVRSGQLQSAPGSAPATAAPSSATPGANAPGATTPGAAAAGTTTPGSTGLSPAPGSAAAPTTPPASAAGSDAAPANSLRPQTPTESAPPAEGAPPAPATNEDAANEDGAAAEASPPEADAAAPAPSDAPGAPESEAK